MKLVATNTGQNSLNRREESVSTVKIVGTEKWIGTHASKPYGTHVHKPNGEWNRFAEIMMINFAEMNNPTFSSHQPIGKRRVQ